MMGSNKIYGVALGPGDPELVTLKALKCLQKADVIYYPGSISPKGEKSSFSKKILDELELHTSQVVCGFEPEVLKRGVAGDLDNSQADSCIHSDASNKGGSLETDTPNEVNKKETEVPRMEGIFISMSFDRTETEKVYHKCYSEMLSLYKEGKNIAFVSEGDISFFSTFSYFIEKLKADDIAFDMIPGIPAFIMAGSRAKLPLVLQRDNLKVLPAPSSAQEVIEAAATNDTVVVMKLSTIKKELVSLLEKLESGFVYCEKLGTEEEFITSDINELRERKIPYFSLLLVNKYV